MRPIVNPPSTAHTPSPTHTLQAFEEMRARGCAPDTIVYNAIIDVLWETGVGWAQRRAVALFRQASQEGLIRWVGGWGREGGRGAAVVPPPPPPAPTPTRSLVYPPHTTHMPPPPPPPPHACRRHSHACGDSLELSLHSTTAGVALLSLHCWLLDMQ